MKSKKSFTQLADAATIEKTVKALASNGISAVVVDTAESAKRKVLEILPKQAEVMNMTSMTLEGITLVKEILESGQFNSVRNKLNTMDDATQGTAKRRLGAAPEWVVGSVHAVTEEGQAMVASNTGSQLPAYAYGAAHVIWVVGTHKIVKNIEEGMQRIYEHSLPLESERAKKAYGTSGSFVSKILIVNREVQPNRITMVLVNEMLGF
jgi:hypothetical protein